MSVQIVSYEEVDRLFFEHLRLAVVNAGLLPDQTAYSNQADYEAARATLKAGLPEPKELVDVFGVSTDENRDEKTSSKFYINRKESLRGNIGANCVYYYEEYDAGGGQTKFRKKLYPEESRILQYEVGFITDNVKYERILSSLVDNVLGYKRYMNTIGADGAQTAREVFIQNVGSMDYSKGKYLERTFRYAVVDVFVQSPVLITDTIVPMTTVTVGLYQAPQSKIPLNPLPPDPDVSLEIDE